MEGGPRYKRILIKLSGESLMGASQYGIDPDKVADICREIIRLRESGVEIGLVVGGGNIFRGLRASQAGMNRVTADHMGMLATVINALSLQDQFELLDIPVRVLSAVGMDKFAEKYTTHRAIDHLEKGRIVIFAAGTGSPIFTTDTAASLRAIEIGAEIVIKATRVDGVYSADPEKDDSATFYPELSYQDVLTDDLKVMDATSIALCKENNIPILVFNLNVENNLYRAGMGEQVGTIVR
jgi:uridylate kinase